MTGSTRSEDAVTVPWATDVLDFWFTQVGEAGWWSHDAALDADVAARFADLWAEQRSQPAETFLDRADHALAAILLFDQFPRNMFRGTGQAFATDPLARDIAHGAVAQGYDVQIGGAGRTFFYMPFLHSEDLDDQQLSLRLFEGAGDEKSLAFARDHHAVIERFGRFPHRNAPLGREDRPGEAEAIAQGQGW